jgi:hypothetical protein
MMVDKQPVLNDEERMKRKVLWLTLELEERVRLQAKTEQISESDVMRRAVARDLQHTERDRQHEGEAA